MVLNRERNYSEFVRLPSDAYYAQKCLKLVVQTWFAGATQMSGVGSNHFAWKQSRVYEVTVWYNDSFFWTK